MNTKLVIRSASVWENPNIRTWDPVDPDKIAEIVMLDIGPKSEKSCDSFSIRVATPAGLTMLEAKNGVLATRPLLIMQRYDFNDLWSWLESTVEKCEGESWQDCIDNLRRYFDWEYQEYKEV